MNRTPEQIKAKVKQMQNLFKAYPDIFPPGYFRFLAGGLKKEITRRTIFMNNDQGFYFSWWQGQRRIQSGGRLRKSVCPNADKE